jgi:hypothetical protein
LKVSFPIMTLELAIVLVILGLTIVLMAVELWQVEVVESLVVVAFVSTKLITPEQALNSFGDALLVMIASVLVRRRALCIPESRIGSVRSPVAAPCDFSSSAS